ncbi:RBBP9/YdeN family alpha/beta hydrolase [Nocardioides insulae]|uniref:RBBP9/YdeN family alpha/beta hydrolase n=1 Tax=Nocardioides insulae TaxID=394734 RepID=UPI000428B6EC|nr:alpha/beta hydrolase [Nocardioides insulae]
MSTPSLVLVPGLRGPAPKHWQTWLSHRQTDQGRQVRTVPLRGRDHDDLAERVADLEEAVSAAAGPVVIAAHSAGVITTVHWAARHPASTGAVRGALLATPPDLVSPLAEEYPSLDRLAAGGWTPVPRHRLPFPSVVAVSTDDRIGDLPRIEEYGAAWGSRLENLGAVGHLNPAAGYGPWWRGEELLAQLGMPLRVDVA